MHALGEFHLAVVLCAFFICRSFRLRTHNSLKVDRVEFCQKDLFMCTYLAFHPSIQVSDGSIAAFHRPLLSIVVTQRTHP